MRTVCAGSNPVGGMLELALSVDKNLWEKSTLETLEKSVKYVQS